MTSWQSQPSHEVNGQEQTLCKIQEDTTVGICYLHDDLEDIICNQRRLKARAVVDVVVHILDPAERQRVTKSSLCTHADDQEQPG